MLNSSGWTVATASGPGKCERAYCYMVDGERSTGLSGEQLEVWSGWPPDLAARCHRAAMEGRWATTVRFYAGPTLLVIANSDTYHCPPKPLRRCFKLSPNAI